MNSQRALFAIMPLFGAALVPPDTTQAIEVEHGEQIKLDLSTDNAGAAEYMASVVSGSLVTSTFALFRSVRRRGSGRRGRFGGMRPVVL